MSRFWKLCKSLSFEAMIMDEEKGLPIIIEDKCTGCGKCVEECPRSIITLLPAREQVVEACVSLASPGRPGSLVRRDV